MLLVASRADAQLSLTRFDPTPAGDRLFGVNSADVAEHLTFGARLTPDWAHNPLVLHDARRMVVPVVANQLFANMGLSFSLWQRLMVSIDLPIALAQSGPSPLGLQSPSGIAAGELRMGARARLVTAFAGQLTVGVGVFVWAPLSQANASFASDAFVRGRAELLLSGQRGRFFWSAALGVELRRQQEYLGVSQGSMARVNFGAGVLLLENRALQLGPEITAAVMLKSPNLNNLNAEALLGARYRFLNHIEVGLGAGVGLLTGIGTPDVRVVASLGYVFTFGKDKPILVKQDAPASAPIAPQLEPPVESPIAQSVEPASAPALVAEAPEVSPALVHRETPRRIELREQIQFKTGSDVILRRSEATL